MPSSTFKSSKKRGGTALSLPSRQQTMGQLTTIAGTRTRDVDDGPLNTLGNCLAYSDTRRGLKELFNIFIKPIDDGPLGKKKPYRVAEADRQMSNAKWQFLKRMKQQPKAAIQDFECAQPLDSINERKYRFFPLRLMLERVH